MAKWKWTPARRRAFNKMRAAAKAKKRRGSASNPRRRRRRKNGAPSVAMVPVTSNPRRKRARRVPRARRAHGGGFLNRAIALVIPGGSSMARKRKKRKNPGALMVNPSRRRRRKNPRRSHARRRNPGRRYRRRNPSIMSTVKSGGMLVLKAAIPATVGGIILGFADAKLLGARGTAFSVIGKSILAAIVGLGGKRFLGEAGSGVAVGAILGSIGHEFGIKLGGGVVARTKREGMQELISDPGDDPEVREAIALLETEGAAKYDGTSLAESYADAVASNYGGSDDMGDDE